MRKLDFFRFGLFLNSSATDIVSVTLPSTAVETAIAQCTSRWAMARGHRLNNSIVLAAVHGLSGLFRAVSAVEPSFSFSFFPPSPPLPIPNKQPRFCGRKAIWSRHFCLSLRTVFTGLGPSGMWTNQFDLNYSNDWFKSKVTRVLPDQYIQQWSSEIESKEI